ncbi:MAG: nucleoside hydrolase [Planctomycetota bacterium]
MIFDTDIGDDIDDTWALGMILNSPELDVKLVVGDQGKPLYRARLIAKFLQTVDRTDVPVGIGGGQNRDAGGNQSKWVKDYRLKDYPGQVHEDGIQAIIDVIMTSERPVTVVAVGPLPNIAEALKREPRIAQRARFVGMHGSVRRGYGGSENVSAEYNVRANPKACRKVLSAPWDVTITPLDTCGLVQLKGGRYQKVLNSSSPVAQAIIQNYRIWSQARRHDHSDTKSSTLFDTVAVYLAFDRELLTMERLGIRVTDDGYTRVDANAKKMNVATAWKDQDAFKDLLVRRVTSEP